MDISPEQLEMFEWTIRIFARIGAILWVIALYRLWTTFASPVLQKSTWPFVICFAIALGFSIILNIIDYYTTTPWARMISMTFNVSFTYALAFYVNNQANKIRRTRGSSEYLKYSTAMDEYIASLKKSV